VTEPTTNDAALAAILATLDAIGAAVCSELVVVDEKIGELRRQARAEPHRRGGRGSRDARKYALGSAMIMADLEQIDPPVLSGLLAHPDLMLRWMVEARLAHGPGSFGDLVCFALADADRFYFCRQWGRIIEWRYRRALYDKTVLSFVNSGRDGPREKWRRYDVTDDQAGLISKLCDILEEPLPEILTRGEAFDWIYKRGGNPEFWAEPETPHERRD
jgi:hypothetical protein